jgi:hypothetical protein
MGPEISRLNKAEPPPETHHAMARAIEAQRQAEAMQRDPRLAVERYVDSLPGLLDRERAFLKKYPALVLEDEKKRILQSEFNAALGEGFARDSDAFQDRVLSGIVRRLEGRHNQPPENGNAGVRAAAAVAEPPQMAEPSIERMADHQIHRTLQVADATPLAVSANLPLPEPAPRKSSIPMAAPVSREIPNQAGQRISPTDTRITLNPAEREIARSSYHWLAKDQAENLYARQKQKLAAMRKAGTYSE